MIDSHGREINYLRISLTDRCNLRCNYCLPDQGMTFMPVNEFLTGEEIERVVRAAAVVGIDKVRLTGGEPTLRVDIVDIVRRLAHLPGINELVMTTNGLRLPELASGLAQAGLHRVNIHIDSLDGVRLSHMMRFNSLSKARAGIEAAERTELQPIKHGCRAGLQCTGCG